MKSFSTGALFTEAAAIMREKRSTKIWQYFLLTFGVWGVTYLVFGQDSFMPSLLMGYTVAMWSLSFVDTKTFSYSNLFDRITTKQFIYFLLAFILATMLIILGFIALIIPGIILSIHFIFTRYVAVDKKLSPVAALKESRRLTKGNRWKILWFLVVSTLINLLGFICLGVGLLYTMPLTSVARALLYRKMAE